MEDNPYRSPNEPGIPSPAPRRRSPFRIVALYLAAFVGVEMGSALTRSSIGPLAHASGAVFGGIIGLGIAVIILLRHDAT